MATNKKVPAVKTPFVTMITDTVKAAADSWLANTNEASLTRIIHTHLDKEVLSLALQCIGFSNRYGRVEVDNCNGRRSHIVDLVDGVASTALKKLVSEGMTLLFEDKKAMKDMRSAIRDQLLGQIRQAVTAECRKAVEAQLAETVHDMVLVGLEEATRTEHGLPPEAQALLERTHAAAATALLGRK